MLRYFEINEAGHNIRCKLRCNDIRAIEKAVIFVHGFGGHKDNGAAETFAQKLLSKHKTAAMISFNLPCHGDDVKKKLQFADCLTYLELVTAHVRDRFTPELYAYATSFGGYVLLNYLLEKGNPFRRIALRCPAVNMYDAITTNIMGPEELEKISRGRETAVGFDRKIPVTPAFLEEIKSRDIRQQDFLDYAEDICIIHGTADEIISWQEAQHFADEALMEFFSVEGADHRFRDPRKMDQAIKYMMQWFAM